MFSSFWVSLSRRWVSVTPSQTVRRKIQTFGFFIKICTIKNNFIRILNKILTSYSKIKEKSKLLDCTISSFHLQPKELLNPLRKTQRSLQKGCLLSFILSSTKVISSPCRNLLRRNFPQTPFASQQLLPE